jgi:hypothetical protein
MISTGPRKELGTREPGIMPSSRTSNIEISAVMILEGAYKIHWKIPRAI